MDLFTERIVTKKKDYVDYLIMVGTIIVSFILAFIIVLIAGPLYFGIALVLVAAIAYFGYRIITSRNIEFEYSLTNRDLEISKIIAKRKRKRIFYGNCREFEVVDKVTSNRHQKVANSEMTKIRAASSMKSQDVYYFISQYNNKKVIVYFDPGDEILDKIKSFNRKAFL